jgi:membrane protein
LLKVPFVDLSPKCADSFGMILYHNGSIVALTMIAEVKFVLKAMKKGFRLLRHKDPLILSSSTAFFATFSLSPIIIILVGIVGLYFKSDRFNTQLFRTIGATVGTETAHDLQTIVNNFMAIESNWWITIAGSIFFLFVATTLLGVIKLAIQKIWHIKPKSKLHLKYYSRERLTQIGFILFTGVLFFLALFIDASVGVSLDYLQSVWPSAAITLIRWLNVIFTVIVFSVWFTVLFKTLPEANISWDISFSGGLMTGVLFSLGRFALGKLLVHARVATIFGASTSFALLLLFIFYSSFILYYGVAFTHEYGDMENNPIYASKYAVEYEERTIENKNAAASVEHSVKTK